MSDRCPLVTYLDLRYFYNFPGSRGCQLPWGLVLWSSKKYFDGAYSLSLNLCVLPIHRGHVLYSPHSPYCLFTWPAISRLYQPSCVSSIPFRRQHSDINTSSSDLNRKLGHNEWHVLNRHITTSTLEPTYAQTVSNHFHVLPMLIIRLRHPESSNNDSPPDDSKKKAQDSGNATKANHKVPFRS